jgi:hypothetical protein
VLALIALPWLLYAGLVFTAWWFIAFDGKPQTDDLGWVLLAVALPVLFVAARVSSWERRWLKLRFSGESWIRGPSPSGGLLARLLDWP